jgi:hypothetical protein
VLGDGDAVVSGTHRGQQFVNEPAVRIEHPSRLDQLAVGRLDDRRDTGVLEPRRHEAVRRLLEQIDLHA